MSNNKASELAGLAGGQGYKNIDIANHLFLFLFLPQDGHLWLFRHNNSTYIDRSSAPPLYLNG